MAVHPRTQSVQLESAERIVPPATHIAGACESIRPHAVPSGFRASHALGSAPPSATLSCKTNEGAAARHALMSSR